VEEVAAPSKPKHRHTAIAPSIRNTPILRSDTLCKQEETVPCSLLSNGSVECPPCEVTKESLHLLYFDFSGSLEAVTYRAGHSEPDFYFCIFCELLDDLKYRRLNPPSSSKLRASIVKRAAEEYVRETCGACVKRESQRMTETDRLLFQRANIEPPSNVNAEYITRLFASQPFQHFFREYVRGDRVAEHYLKRTYEEVGELRRFVERCGGEERLERVEGFMRLRKPMALSDIPPLELEAHRIVEQFCM
jgi:hypothetical protein